MDRFNLAQQPNEFIKNTMVHDLLTTKGTDCLPLIFVDGKLMDQSQYPSRERFIEWTGLVLKVPAYPSLSIVTESGDCSKPGCC